jgi:ribonuclease T1
MGPGALMRGLAALVCVALLAFGGFSEARTPRPLPTIAERDLPPEARETLALIRAGGPFPYAKDGSVFQNRERRLPPQPRGFYREYTVRTPGERDRGARRIVTGGRTQHYWTPDHYRTFRRIEEADR